MKSIISDQHEEYGTKSINGKINKMIYLHILNKMDLIIMSTCYVLFLFCAWFQHNKLVHMFSPLLMVLNTLLVD